jgi:tetratricopeptide (TPR) repeat protein
MSTGTPESNESFVAFISYSHRDAVWARWVQRALERYRLPADFARAQGLERKLGKVFRDREELATGQNLDDHLTKALDASENLIVICSGSATASPWVAKEIDYFKSLGKGDRIFCLLVEGGSENFPTPLLTDIEGRPLEPLAADPRETGDGKRLAKLKLISGLVNTNLDQLARREYAQRQRQMLAWGTAALAFILITGGLAGSAYFFEQQRAAEVARNVETATRLSSRIEEAYDYLDKTSLQINAEIISEYLEDIDDSELTLEQTSAIASTLRTQGNAAYRLGNVDKAFADLERSRELYQRFAQENPKDIDAAIESAFADFYVASTYYYEGDYANALAPMRQYASDITSLYRRYPNHPGLLSESVHAPTGMVGLLSNLSTKFSKELEQATKSAIEAAEAAISIASDNFDIIDAYNLAMYHAADAYMKSCRVFDALPLRQRAVVNARRALSLNPDNREYRDELANVLSAQGDSLMNSMRLSEGIDSYLEALAIYEGLLATDPNNRYQKRQLLRSQIVLFAATVYHPRLADQVPDLEQLIAEVTNPTTRMLARELDLELRYLSRLSEYAIAKGQRDEAKEYLEAFINIARSNPDRDSADRFELLYQLRTRLLEHSGNVATSDFFEKAELVRPLPAKFANIMDRLSPREDCASQQFSWYGHVLNKDMEKANQIATNLWNQGSRGLALAFMAKQLGIPHPPELE